MDVNNWELNGQQVKELRLAITNAFTTETALRQLVLENMNVLLGTVARGENVGELIFSLIEWACSEGRVGELVIAAAYEKSKNEKIQEYIEKNIDDLIQFDNDLIPSKFVISLIKIINQANDFTIIWEIAKNSLPSNITVVRSQDIQNFEQPELSNWFKCFMLLKLLLEDYPLLEERSSILTLVEHLLKASSLDDSIKQKLNEWLDKLDPNVNHQQDGAEQTSVLSRQSTCEALQAYLMITVNPEKSKTKVRVFASLLCISPTGNRKEIPVHLNPESNERGVLCTWKKLPETLEKFIKKSIEDELERLANELECVSYDLTIEVFLPSEYLCKPVDCWEIKDDFDNPVCLGSKHRLVLRSYDRVAKPGLKNNFSKSWHNAKAFLTQNPDAKSLQERIKHLDKIDCNRLTGLEEELRQKIGLKVICPLPKSEREMVKFFQAMLESGIPFAFWTRCCEFSSNEVILGIDQFLTLELLLNSCNLLEKVRKERALALED